MPNTMQITTMSGRTLEEVKAGIRMRMRNMVFNALEIGNDLIEAKEACEHGQWLPFLRDVGFSSSTAANYMRIAKEVSADSRVAQLPYTKILAVLAAPPEEREELAAAAEDMSAAEIRRLTEERNRAAEAANAETARADMAEEALKRSEADAKEIYDKNASLRVEIQNLQVKLERVNDEKRRNEMAQLKTTEDLKTYAHALESRLEDKEEEMQRVLRQCDEEAREEEREKAKKTVEDLQAKVEKEIRHLRQVNEDLQKAALKIMDERDDLRAKLLTAENNRVEVEKIPEDYEIIKKKLAAAERSAQDLIEAAADAEERAAAAEAELEEARAESAQSGTSEYEKMHFAMKTFLMQCELMACRPEKLVRDAEKVQRDVDRLMAWCEAIKRAMNVHIVEGAVV